jgi:hypothetical protein
MQFGKWELEGCHCGPPDDGSCVQHSPYDSLARRSGQREKEQRQSRVYAAQSCGLRSMQAGICARGFNCRRGSLGEMPRRFGWDADKGSTLLCTTKLDPHPSPSATKRQSTCIGIMLARTRMQFNSRDRREPAVGSQRSTFHNELQHVLLETGNRRHRVLRSQRELTGRYRPTTGEYRFHAASSLSAAGNARTEQ